MAAGEEAVQEQLGKKCATGGARGRKMLARDQTVGTKTRHYGRHLLSLYASTRNRRNLCRPILYNEEKHRMMVGQ